ncbi:MAG: hypothetical protein ACE5J9_11490 [Methanosarcinales archaeon]
MIFRIFEEDLIDSKLPLKAKEYGAKIRNEHELIFGENVGKEFSVKVVKKNGKFYVDIQDDIVKKIHLNKDEVFVASIIANYDKMAVMIIT